MRNGVQNVNWGRCPKIGDSMNIDIKLLAVWLKEHNTDNGDSNMILDGLEELFGLETKLAKEMI